MMTGPVRVLYEIHPHILGGTERFLARFLERLDRELYEPVVISQKVGNPLRLIRATGVRTAALADYFKVSGIEQLASFIRDNGIDLVQSNYYSSNLAMASNLADVPHAWRLGGHLNFSSRVRSRRDKRSALEAICLLSDLIVCNSNYVKSQFEVCESTPPITVVPNGISISNGWAGAREGSGFHVGMVAHFAPQKRHEDFIRAAELVCLRRDDVSFAILGGCYADSASRSYAAEVRRLAGSLQRRGKLSISEFADERGGPPGGLDVIAHPSVMESCSNAVLEAMAAGIPVIAARSGGNPELVVNGKTGLLIPPMRPKALARAILHLAEDRQLAGRMGRAAHERVRERFLLDECVRSYEAVYSEAISRRKC
jgi:glycosyltransferase involved in cell wall biosynthesis